MSALGAVSGIQLRRLGWGASLLVIAGLAAGAPAWEVHLHLHVSEATRSAIAALGKGSGKAASSTRSARASLAAPHAIPPWADALVVLVLVGLVVAAGWPLLVALRRRARRQPPEAPATVARRSAAPQERVELAEAVEAIGRSVSLESSPRGVVLRCWRELEETLAARASAPGPSETSGQLARRVLQGLAVGAAPMRTLEQLYERARFSPADVAPATADAARAALGALGAALRAAGSGESGP